MMQSPAMWFVIGVLLGFFFFITIFHSTYQDWKIESFAENDLLRELVRRRTERYIDAVASQTTNNEIEKAATDEATQRLAAHGVNPP
jgi:hypothetical protein